MKRIIIVDNETASFALAEKLAVLLQPGDVIALEGDLGAGKTTFTKGVATALGITRTVNSPTFTIMKQYQGRVPLYHFDVYRLEFEDEDFGFDEYFYGDGVTIVEWAKLIASQLPSELLTIRIEYVDENRRSFSFMPKGERYVSLVKEIFSDECFSD